MTGQTHAAPKPAAENPQLARALNFAGQGVSIIGVMPGTKRPYPGTHGALDATTDTERLRTFWNEHPGALPAMVAGKFGDRWIAFLDIDPKDKAERSPEENLTRSREILAEIEAQYGALPACWKRRSKSGSLHVPLVSDEPIPYQPKGAVHGEAEIRGTTGTGSGYYVVLWDGPSAEKGPIAELPAEWRNAIGTPRKREHVEAPKHINQEKAIWWAKTVLADYPPAVEGENGEPDTYAAICKVRDIGVSEENAPEALSEWNERCVPPWQPDELAAKISHSYKYAQNEVGVDSIEAMFRPQVPEGIPAEHHEAARALMAAGVKVEPQKAANDQQPKPNLSRFASPVEDYEPPETLVEGLVPRGGLVAIAAVPGRSKSEAATGLSYSVASGAHDFLGRKIAGGAHLVVYLDLERYLTTGQRLSAYAGHDVRGPRRIADVPIKMAGPPFTLTNKDDVHQLVSDLNALAAETGLPLALLVIDSLGAAMGGQDTNTSGAGATAGHALRAIRDQTGAAILCVCHTPKSGEETVSGSVQLDAVFDIEAFMRSEDGGQTGEMFVRKDNVLALEEHERHIGWQRETLQGKRTKVHRLIAGVAIEAAPKAGRAPARKQGQSLTDYALVVLQNRTVGGTFLPHEEWLAEVTDKSDAERHGDKVKAARKAIGNLRRAASPVVEGDEATGYRALGTAAF